MSAAVPYKTPGRLAISSPENSGHFTVASRKILGRFTISSCEKQERFVVSSRETQGSSLLSLAKTVFCSQNPIFCMRFSLIYTFCLGSQQILRGFYLKPQVATSSALKELSISRQKASFAAILYIQPQISCKKLAFDCKTGSIPHLLTLPHPKRKRDAAQLRINAPHSYSLQRV